MNSRINISIFRKPRLFVLILTMAIISYTAFGNVVLPHIIGSGMVLQRNAPVVVWGWADANERVSVQFSSKTLNTRADKLGNWKLVFPSMEAGGPYEMIIKGKNTIRLSDILIGEVWICSGQSNMEWPLSEAENGMQEVGTADYPEIRLFDVPRRVDFIPAKDLSQGEWRVCSPASVNRFSAIGYFFGRNLYQNLKVPIGLVNSSWGGTLIESWTSEDALAKIPQYIKKIDELHSIDVKSLENLQKDKYDKIRRLITGNADGLVNGIALWADEKFDDADWPVMNVPGLWEQSILPGFDGVVWFRFAVEVPPEMIHSALILSLGKIDDSDMTWLNGVLIGKTTSKYDRERNYEIPEGVLKAGRNIITVRIEDTGGGGGFWSEADVMCLKNSQKSLALSGNWKFKISPVNYNFYESIAGPNDYPSGLYNSMIHPLLNYTFAGALWYQGESNAENAYLYRTLLPLMINSWREKWNNPGLAFLIVQLANYKPTQEQPSSSDWAELREAQLMALSVPKTGIAVTIDIGDADNIHPRNKQDVGYRLALAARKVAYGENIVYSGPVYKSMQVKGNAIELVFDQTGSGLIAIDKYGYLKGFSIAGADRQFHWAQARISNNRIIVTSADVSDPVAVRYAWADNPADANLFNLEGLPASPFRTDSWKGITEDNNP